MFYKTQFLIYGFMTFFIALFARLILFFVIPNHIANPWDSVSYGAYAFQMLQAQGIEDVFNQVRPPVYPFFIATVYFLQGISADTPYEHIYALLNSSILTPLVLFQSLMGIVSCVVFYLILAKLVSLPLAFWFAVIFSVHPLILPWDRLILTESLSISFFVCYIFFLLRFYEYPTFARGVIVLVFALLLTWLRSVYMLLIPVSFAIFFVQRRSIKSLLQAYVFVGMFFLPVLFHIWVNAVYHRVPSFQVMGAVNMFGRVLLRPYPIPDIPNNRVSHWMRSYYTPPSTYINPFPILESMSELYFLYNRDLLNEMKEYTNIVVRHNIASFFRDVLLDVPKAFEVNSSIALLDYPFLFLFQEFSVVLLVLCSLLWVITFPYFIICFLFSRSLAIMMGMLTGCLFFLFLFFGVLYGYTESSRYILASIPPLFLYIGIFIDSIVRKKAYAT